MKMKTFLVLALGASFSASADWSGSKTLNNNERVQIIGENIYVNLHIDRDFSFLVNVPLSSTKPEPYNSKNTDWSQFGTCPFNAIDMSEYDNATIARGGEVNERDKARQDHALKLVQERNRKSRECRAKLTELAKAEHEENERERISATTLNNIALQENELDQTNTETYRVVTTGSDKSTFYRRLDNCLQDCSYTEIKTTVMFEYKDNAYIVSKVQRKADVNFVKVNKKQLDISNILGFNTKVIPMIKP